MKGEHVHSTAVDEALHWQDIGHLILSAQRRCSVGIAREPLMLARRVMAIIDEARTLDRATAGRGRRRTITWSVRLWEPGPTAGDMATVVEITEFSVAAGRVAIDPTWTNGQLCLLVPEVA